MKTIFSFDPTIGELIDLFSYDPGMDMICHGLTCNPFPVSEYADKVNKKIAAFDIGLLLQYRGDLDGAAKWMAKCPEIWEEYRKVRDGVS